MIFFKNRRKEKDNVAGNRVDHVESVKVALGGTRVGRLAMKPDRICVFEYDPEWLQQGFSISPFHIPLRPGLFTARRDPFEGLFGVFNDNLPDGWGTLLIDRWLRREGIEPASFNLPDRLTLVGSNGMGALTFEPDQEIQPRQTSLKWPN